MLRCKIERRRWLLATCIVLLVSITANAQVDPGRVEQSSRSATLAPDAAGGMALWPSRERHAGQAQCEATGSPTAIQLLPMLGSLRLTDAQHDQVSAILHAQVPALREKERIARLTMTELRRLSDSTRVDRARAAALADVGSRALRNVALLRADVEQRIYALLTEGQQQRLKVIRWSGGQPCSQTSTMRFARWRSERPFARS